MKELSVLQKDFVEALNYPSKKYRALALEPISVPRDPLITSYPQLPGKKISVKNFFYSLYFTAFDVRDYGPSILKFMKIFNSLSVKKVYLETYRDGYHADTRLLSSAKKSLEKEGFEVSGAVTPTHFSSKTSFNEFSSATGCYSDPAALKKLKAEFERAAAVFNEIIIDDWFFTVCRCPSCEKARGKKTKEEFRSKLILDASKKYIIAPAKKINKKVKLILKLPQWFGNYINNGYDIEKLAPLFDGISAGTEARDPLKTPFLPVHGSLLINYLRSIAPGKVTSAWFDPYMCTKETYCEQAYQSLLGGAKELILFSAGILAQPLVLPLAAELASQSEKFDRFSSFKNIFSVPVLRDPSAYDNEHFEQYLLSAGIPAYMRPPGKISEKIVVITAQSCPPSGIAKLFASLIKENKEIIITAQAALSAGRQFKIKKLKTPVKVKAIKYSGREEEPQGGLYITYDMQGLKNYVLANNAYPVIAFRKIKKTGVWILNLPHTKDEILSHTNAGLPAGHRVIFRLKGFTEALRSIFKGYANVNLYNKIKTFYKHTW
ncbi:MAG TPA: hypothetical protein ENN43_02720 [bacterium]|nr:hypothetical protein [bacterium]